MEEQKPVRMEFDSIFEEFAITPDSDDSMEVNEEAAQNAFRNAPWEPILQKLGYRFEDGYYPPEMKFSQREGHTEWRELKIEGVATGKWDCIGRLSKPGLFGRFFKSYDYYHREGMEADEVRRAISLYFTNQDPELIALLQEE